jgi:wobble nucleotide-excising tRNase
VFERIQLLRNIGQFDSVSAGSHISFTKLTLLYAENARGKTTLAAILRSLSTGNAGLISERHRLAAPHAPHVVLQTRGGASFIFQGGAWSANLPQVAVFDDAFVAQNVCSGIDIETEHRQHLHELILGSRGVSLNTTLQAHIARIEEHNRTLKSKGDAIPSAARGALAVDTYCALPPIDNIAEAVQAAERNLAAARSAQAVRQEPGFAAVELPGFDAAAINALLGRDLPGLEAEAAARVQAHLATLGDEAESWVGDGMHRIIAEVCPFCAQDLSASPVIDHYRAYFSEGYASLKQAIADEVAGINAAHGGDVPAAFERAVRVVMQRREFWRAFTHVPDFAIDTAAIAREWKGARDAVLAALREKQGAPLDPTALPAKAFAAIASYDEVRAPIATISSTLQASNAQIAIVKERAAAANVATLTADLTKLRAVEARYSAEVAPLCQAYLDQKTAKAATETLRDQAREALDRYRSTVFPAYETAINVYLGKFNASFRLGSVNSMNTRGGSSCSYNVMINNIPVALTAGTGPSFRNTLSAGDRNTLALAFFFASLDQDPQLSQKIVAIDDPMTSLDEHRALTTVQEVRRLVGRVSQVVVLSHSKPFLCAIWDGADTLTRSAVKIVRDGTGSTLAVWDVRQDSITEHDKRHAKVVTYIQASNAAEERAVAAALRPILEAFMRVAYPEAFPPGTLLGPFINLCQQRQGAANQILGTADIAELRDLLDYANKFHHDTNAAWETETINDSQLVHFCQRTLNFARR